MKKRKYRATLLERASHIDSDSPCILIEFPEVGRCCLLWQMAIRSGTCGDALEAGSQRSGVRQSSGAGVCGIYSRFRNRGVGNAQAATEGV
jgi:hypothetical protein